jgi:hypothetical protein
MSTQDKTDVSIRLGATTHLDFNGMRLQIDMTTTGYGGDFNHETVIIGRKPKEREGVNWGTKWTASCGQRLTAHQVLATYTCYTTATGRDRANGFLITPGFEESSLMDENDTEAFKGSLDKTLDDLREEIHNSKIHDRWSSLMSDLTEFNSAMDDFDYTMVARLTAKATQVAGRTFAYQSTRMDSTASESSGV